MTFCMVESLTYGVYMSVMSFFYDVREEGVNPRLPPRVWTCACPLILWINDLYLSLNIIILLVKINVITMHPVNYYNNNAC